MVRMDLLTARSFPIPLIVPERLTSDTLHNMLVPINPDEPHDVVETIDHLGVRIIGWTFAFQPEHDNHEYLCLFTGNVCCTVTDQGLRFIAEKYCWGCFLFTFTKEGGKSEGILLKSDHARLAQLVEHGIDVLGVRGSSPLPRTFECSQSGASKSLCLRLDLKAGARRREAGSRKFPAGNYPWPSPLPRTVKIKIAWSACAMHMIDADSERFSLTEVSHRSCKYPLLGNYRYRHAIITLNDARVADSIVKGLDTFQNLLQISVWRTSFCYQIKSEMLRMSNIFESDDERQCDGWFAAKFALKVLS